MKNKTYIIKDRPKFCQSYYLWKKLKSPIQDEYLSVFKNKELHKALYIEYGDIYYFKIESEALINSFRNLISNSLKRKGYSKKSRTYEILGCTYEEFKLYIEKQFTKGMNWENKGQWHFDHIYPISLAKDEEELIRLNHYTNFQPLWAIDNLKKSNKIIDNTQLKLI
jgi:hypothetical protein